MLMLRSLLFDTILPFLQETELSIWSSCVLKGFKRKITSLHIIKLVVFSQSCSVQPATPRRQRPTSARSQASTSRRPAHLSYSSAKLNTQVRYSIIYIQLFRSLPYTTITLANLIFQIIIFINLFQWCQNRVSFLLFLLITRTCKSACIKRIIKLFLNFLRRMSTPDVFRRHVFVRKKSSYLS